MPESRVLALAEARKLLRTFGAAPDPRHRALAILAVLKRTQDWAAAARHEIEAADAWLKAYPSVTSLEPRLKAIMARLSEGGARGPGPL